MEAPKSPQKAFGPDETKTISGSTAPVTHLAAHRASMAYVGLVERPPPYWGVGIESSAMSAIQLQTAPTPFPRVPLETTVGLTFAQCDDYFVESSANISQSGIFIKTGAPTMPGSVVMFEIWLEEFFKIVQGVGKVVWVRGVAEGPERPPGMGVRYLKIDRSSREMIQRVVNERLQQNDQVIDHASPGDEDDESDGEATSSAGYDTAEIESVETPESEVLEVPALDEVCNEPADSLSAEHARSRPILVLRWEADSRSVVALYWLLWSVVVATLILL